MPAMVDYQVPQTNAYDIHMAMVAFCNLDTHPDSLTGMCVLAYEL